MFFRPICLTFLLFLSTNLSPGSNLITFVSSASIADPPVEDEEPKPTDDGQDDGPTPFVYIPRIIVSVVLAFAVFAIPAIFVFRRSRLKRLDADSPAGERKCI